MKKKQKKPELLRLDLACGDSKREGFRGVDRVKTKSTDIVHDLLKFPWPFADESTIECHISHFIEHIPMIEVNGVDLFFRFFDEIYRILVPKGRVSIVAPYYSSVRAWQDPTHRRTISERTFLYLNKQWREENKLAHYKVNCDFGFSYGYSIGNPRWQSASEEARPFAMNHYMNVIDDIQVTLTKP